MSKPDPYRPPAWIPPKVAPPKDPQVRTSQLAVADMLAKIAAVHIGLDLGQRHDPSAIAIVEVSRRPSARNTIGRDGQLHPILETLYRVQHMERVDLGTSYLDVAARVVELVGSLWDWERGLRERHEILPYDPQLPWDIWADATGVGRPVMDMLAEGLFTNPKTERAHLHPVVFTHGDRFDRNSGRDGQTDILGKAFLVSRLQVLFQQELIKLPPRHREAEAMARELKDYEIKIDEQANDKYGAFKVGSYDDLVTSLGLAVIEDPGYYTVEYGPGLWP